MIGGDKKLILIKIRIISYSADFNQYNTTNMYISYDIVFMNMGLN